MKKICLATVIVSLFALIFSQKGVAENQTLERRLSRVGQKHVPDEIIVKFKKRVKAKAIADINSRHGTSVLDTSRRFGFKRLRIPRMRNAAEMVELYREDPNVEYAELNYIAYAFWEPNDEYYSYQWNLDNPEYGGIQMEEAWAFLIEQSLEPGGSPDVIVAVVDTGVAYEDYTETGARTREYYLAPDLVQTSFVPGYDFVNNDDHSNDDEGHGTHVAGTIAQSTNNNGQGCAGVAFNCSIMPVKVLGKQGSGTYADVAEGIAWAADNGANVINLSLGGSFPSITLENACAYAYQNGVIIVCASGNDGAATVSYPAAYDAYCIAVGATGYDETLSYYSNYGESLDLVAPGGDLNVDLNNDGYADGVLQQTFNGATDNWGYFFYHGTSMAAPHVSGLAALIISSSVVITPDGVREALQFTAEDLGANGWDENYGWGLIDAYAALVWSSALSLVGHWKMDDNAADTVVLDHAGFNNGTLNGGNNTEDKTVAGKRDAALNFNGADDFVNTGATFTSILQDSFSISCWFKLDDGQPAATNVLYGTLSDSGDDLLQIGVLVNGTLNCQYKAGGNAAVYETAAGTFVDGQETWHHLVFVADSTIGAAGGIKAYLDGAVATPTANNGNTSGVTFGDYAGDNNFYIGALADAADPPKLCTAADLDDIRIYNKALTADEVLNLSFAFLAIGDKEVDEGLNLTFEVLTPDPNQEVFIQDDPNLPFEPNDVFVNKIFNWTPALGDAGSYEVTFAAQHGAFEDFETITITVNAPPVDGLIAHWKMNDNVANATVVDSAGSNDGTYTDSGGAINTDTGDKTGVINGALEFDGDEFINTGATFTSILQDSFSISCWFKLDDGQPAATNVLYGTLSDSGDELLQIGVLVSGTLNCQYKAGGNAATYETAAGTFVDGQETWHHLVFVADSTIGAAGGIKAYLDGAVATPTANNGNTSGVTFGDYAGDNNFYIGALADAADPPKLCTSGDIDDVKIFDRVLSQAEIEVLYNATADTDPPTPNPATWASVPSADSNSSISMTATTSTDPCGVEYYFECTTGGGNDSAWQDSPTYQDTPLSPATQYIYRVKARDKSSNQNETAYSTEKSATTLSAPEWTELTNDDFESGWGSYSDGGSDCRRSVNDSIYAHEGTYCARIRDNSSISSSFYYTNGVDVATPGYTQIKIEFWFYPRSMETSEDFWVQYYDGSVWQTVASFVSRTDFTNGSFYQVTGEDIIINKGSYNFPTDMKIRFMCDASSNADYIYIDEVKVSAQ